MLIVFYVVCTLVFSMISYSFYKGMNTTVTSNSGTNLGSMALSGFSSGLSQFERSSSTRNNRIVDNTRSQSSSNQIVDNTRSQSSSNRIVNNNSQSSSNNPDQSNDQQQRKPVLKRQGNIKTQPRLTKQNGKRISSSKSFLLPNIPGFKFPGIKSPFNIGRSNEQIEEEEQVETESNKETGTKAEPGAESGTEQVNKQSSNTMEFTLTTNTLDNVENELKQKLEDQLNKVNPNSFNPQKETPVAVEKPTEVPPTAKIPTTEEPTEEPAKEPAPDFKLTQNTLDDLQNELKQKLEDQLNKVYTTAQVPPEPEQPPVSEHPEPEPEPEPEPAPAPAPEPEQNTYDEDAKIFYKHWVQIYGTNIKPSDCAINQGKYKQNKCRKEKLLQFFDKKIAIKYINTKLKTPLEYKDNNEFWTEVQQMYDKGKPNNDNEQPPGQMKTQQLLEELGKVGLQMGEKKLKNIGKKIGNTAEKVGKKHNQLMENNKPYRIVAQGTAGILGTLGTAAVAVAKTAGEVAAATARGAL
jgi:hypothetical protein